MITPVKKIVLFILVITILPIIIFSYIQLSGLNENERVLNEIYTNQLESILFSVNQYSEDIVKSWVSKVEAVDLNLIPNQNEKEYNFSKVFYSGSGLNYIIIADSLFRSINQFKRNKTLPDIVKDNKISNSSFDYLLPIISRLLNYQKNNYQKVEPILADGNLQVQLVMVVLDKGMICILGFNKNEFVNQSLRSKMQGASSNKFIISVVDELKDSIIYSSENINLKTFTQSKSLWIIPTYKLSITLKGGTIESLVKERGKTSIYFLLGLLAAMLFLSWFAYRNIKKEIELAKIKSDFVSNVSHELRTPLSLINMFAETLALGRVKSEEKKNEYYNIIQQETERLSKIVNKILSFSKMEAGKWKYSFDNVELNSIVGKVFNNYKFHSESKGFDLRFEPCESDLFIYADHEAISEALINLLDNALKYSSSYKKIVLRTKADNEFACVEVEDFGIGISTEEQKKIFDKFYRVTHGSIHNTKGTGLGLTLVKHIADAHKGFIKLKSQLGIGSTFYLYLPVNKKS